MTSATTATWAVTRRRTRPWARALRPWAKEITLILLLYSLWQYAGAWSIGQASAATARGQTIWHTERVLRLPSERAAQALILPYHSLVHWLNVYYALVHVPALGLCLVWLFVRHRDRYPQARTGGALATGASLIIPLIPVAPPRLRPHLGIVDTAAVV